VLELGTGTGETTLRVLERHPQATVIGLDGSRAMLAYARGALPAERVQLRLARFEEPLPEGPFDLVVSAFAIHHLDGPGKADLFRRVADVLAPGGRFVVADVVVPDDPADVVTPLDEGFDLPSTVADQLAWLTAAGLRAAVAWAHRDLAVLVGAL
jgi:ubiquinone/menaquinone biosynthesis C-methylase UbiE